jgi:outer membrane lipoprotein-sorting protein
MWIMKLIRTALAATLLGTAALASTAIGSPAQMTVVTAQAPVMNATMGADLARLDATLNATNTFTGRFTQTNADGSTDGGRVYIQRPGKLRFEYEGPLLVVSDGVTLVQQDKQLETSDRVPLSATPLEFFLKNDVNLARDVDIVAFNKTPMEWQVSARDGSGEVDGVITLLFDATTLAMRGWIIDDSFGNRTQVALSELRYNADLDPRLFVLRDNTRRDRRR